MLGDGFGYDEELPRGFQDADLEMVQFEEYAREHGNEDRGDLRDEGRAYGGYGESYAERNA